MEQATQDIMQSVLGSEFKVAVDKQDRILKSLALEVSKSQDLIVSKKNEIDDLDKKMAGLKDAIILAYHDKEESFNKDKETFEKTKVNVTNSLEKREKDLDERESKHGLNLKYYNDIVSKFNKEKFDFYNKKKAVCETLEESLKIHSGLLGDAIEALKEPYVEHQTVD